jgi:putative FmdB family regulatory protein
MPLYEYKCDRCGEKFEVLQKFSDEPMTAHEGCGGHVERLVSAPTLQFKGSGWYVTDYARGNTSAPSNGKSGSSSEAKTETKSEAKTENKPAAPAADKK